MADWDLFYSWLDPNPERAEEAYKKLRQSLIKFFTKMKRQDCETLADDTIERLVQILSKSPATLSIDPFRYAVGVARCISLEHFRNHVKPRAEFSDQVLQTLAPATSSAEAELLDRCLARCLGELDRSRRDLLLRYYHFERQDSKKIRDRIAIEMGITINSLRLKIMRIKDELRDCISACREADTAG